MARRHKNFCTTLVESITQSKGAQWFVKGLFLVASLLQLTSGKAEELGKNSLTFKDYQDKYNPTKPRCSDPTLNQDFEAFQHLDTVVDPMAEMPTTPFLTQFRLQEFRNHAQHEVVTTATRMRDETRTQIIRNEDRALGHATSYHIDPVTGRVREIVQEAIPLTAFQEGLDPSESGYVLEGTHEEDRCGFTWTRPAPR